MIFEYCVVVPLTYNKFSIFTNNPASEIGFQVENVETDFTIKIRTHEVPGFEKGKIFENTVTVKLYGEGHPKESMGRENAHKLFCEIMGLLVASEGDAKRIVNDIVNRICKELSLLFVKYNANRRMYQPRVEALWNQTVWRHREFPPFVEAMRKALEKDNGKCKTVMFEENIFIQDSMYYMIYAEIPANELPLSKWLSPNNDVVEFLMTEYYSALGTEKIKSKFFHLFSIIEFCEKEFEKHNGARRIFSDNEVDDIISKIKSYIVKSKKEKALPIIKSGLLKCADIGRAEKLNNILKWMGIEGYSFCGNTQLITKKMLEDIIKVRNKSFHGTQESEELINKEYTEIVEMLLYIDERIINFVKTCKNDECGECEIGLLKEKP